MKKCQTYFTDNISDWRLTNFPVDQLFRLRLDNSYGTSFSPVWRYSDWLLRVATSWQLPTTTLWHCDMGWRCPWLELELRTRVDSAMRQSCMHSKLDTGILLNDTEKNVHKYVQPKLHGAGLLTLLSVMAASNCSRKQFRSQSWTERNSSSQTRSFLNKSNQLT